VIPKAALGTIASCKPFGLSAYGQVFSSSQSNGSKTVKIGPFSFWVISPVAGVQFWTCYCVLNASGLPLLTVELSS
jgi:hypothetical protein